MIHVVQSDPPDFRRTPIEGSVAGLLGRDAASFITCEKLLSLLPKPSMKLPELVIFQQPLKRGSPGFSEKRKNLSQRDIPLISQNSSGFTIFPENGGYTHKSGILSLSIFSDIFPKEKDVKGHLSDTPSRKSKNPHSHTTSHSRKNLSTFFFFALYSPGNDNGTIRSRRVSEHHVSEGERSRKNKLSKLLHNRRNFFERNGAIRPHAGQRGYPSSHENAAGNGTLRSLHLLSGPADTPGTKMPFHGFHPRGIVFGTNYFQRTTVRANNAGKFTKGH